VIFSKAKMRIRVTPLLLNNTFKGVKSKSIGVAFVIVHTFTGSKVAYEAVSPEIHEVIGCTR
jgi:hypothetical protein